MFQALINLLTFEPGFYIDSNGNTCSVGNPGVQAIYGDQNNCITTTMQSDFGDSMGFLSGFSSCGSDSFGF